MIPTLKDIYNIIILDSEVQILRLRILELEAENKRLKTEIKFNERYKANE
jgi:hypothetical protein